MDAPIVQVQVSSRTILPGKAYVPAAPLPIEAWPTITNTPEVAITSALAKEGWPDESIKQASPIAWAWAEVRVI